MKNNIEYKIKKIKFKKYKKNSIFSSFNLVKIEK